MSRKVYRRLLMIFVIWDAACIATVSLPLVRLMREGSTIPAPAILLPLGFGLLPISAFGLWSMRTCGFAMLALALCFVLLSYPSGAILHVLVAIITAIRYYDGDAKKGQAS